MPPPVEMHGVSPETGEPIEISLSVDKTERIEIISFERETNGVAVLAGENPIIGAFADEVIMESINPGEELEEYITEYEDGPDVGRVYHTVFLAPEQTINIKPTVEGELLARTSPGGEKTTIKELNIKNLLTQEATTKDIENLPTQEATK